MLRDNSGIQWSYIYRPQMAVEACRMSTAEIYTTENLFDQGVMALLLLYDRTVCRMHCFVSKITLFSAALRTYTPG